MLQAVDRVASRVEARRAEVIAAVAGPAPTGNLDDWGVDEVAAALRLTPRQAQTQVMTARRVIDDLPAVLAAWLAGDLTGRHVAALVDATTNLPPAAAREVTDRVLRDAGELTVPELRRRALRAAMSVDPAAAERRHQTARRSRHVRTRPAEDGMAWLQAYGPTDEVARIFRTIDALAHATEAVDGIEATRFDALVDLTLGQLTPRSVGREQGQRPVLRVTASLGTVCGVSDEPGDVNGLGPIPASTVRRIAADADWQRLLLDADGHPADVALPVRVPRDAAQALLAGHGDASALVEFVDRWLRAPMRGTASDPATHDPSPALRDYLLTRDRACRFPGCTRRAERCAIDHTIAHPDGPTHPHNCACLCVHHRRLKHEAGWQLTLHPDGTCHWRSPTGRTYTTRPPPYP